MSVGHIFVLDGPAAAGKTYYAHRLIDDEPLTLCPRMTTREPRAEDREYEYITTEEFDRMVREHEFASYRVFLYGTSYGVSKTRVEEILERRENVLIIVDLGTGQQIKDVWPEAVTIFLVSPLEELEVRLRERGYSGRQLSEKLQNASNALSLTPYYDYVLPNRDGEQESVYFQLLSVIKTHLE